MNGLSIMLWLADIVGKVTLTMWWVFGATLGVIILINAARLIDWSGEKGKPVKEFEPTAKREFYFALAMIILINIIPSKETIYLIAGSEIGETIITAPENMETMGKVRELVNSKLDEMISANKGEDGE